MVDVHVAPIPSAADAPKLLDTIDPLVPQSLSSSSESVIIPPSAAALTSIAAKLRHARKVLQDKHKEEKMMKDLLKEDNSKSKEGIKNISSESLVAKLAKVKKHIRDTHNITEAEVFTAGIIENKKLKEVKVNLDAHQSIITKLAYAKKKMIDKMKEEENEKVNVDDDNDDGNNGHLNGHMNVVDSNIESTTDIASTSDVTNTINTTNSFHSPIIALLLKANAKRIVEEGIATSTSMTSQIINPDAVDTSKGIIHTTNVDTAVVKKKKSSSLVPSKVIMSKGK